jgi:hypothetical protein
MKITIIVVAEAIREFFRWASGGNIRKMRVAVDAGEKYIQTNENKELSKTRKAKLLKHYRKRFFANN